MMFFLDTASVTEVKKWAEAGMVDGVTTNPTLAAIEGRTFIDMIAEMCEVVKGPVSAEVVADDAPEMIKQGRSLSKISEHVVIKVPLTIEGLKACKALSDDNIMVNVTLCFSSAQAILAAKAGATYVSPFIGRLDDIGHNGMDLIHEIREIFDQQGSLTNILAASIRHPQHVVASAKAGADVITMPPKVLEQLYKHPLTDAGVKSFQQDWVKSGLTIGI